MIAPIEESANRTLARYIIALSITIVAIVIYNRLVYHFGWCTSDPQFSDFAAPLYARAERVPTPSMLGWWRMCLPIALFAGWIGWALPSLDKPTSIRRTIAATVVATVVAAIAMNLAIAMMPGGIDSISHPFSRYGEEYITDVPKVRDVISFLRDYPSLMPNLAHHSRTHPPGAVLFLWMVSKVFGAGIVPASIVSIGITALGAIPTILISRDLHGDRCARIASSLYVVGPSLVLFGATSMDGVFLVPCMVALWVYLRAMRADASTAIPLAILLGFVLAIATLLTFASACIALLIGMHWLWSRPPILPRLRLAVISVATFVALFLALYFLTGCNIIACLQSSIGFDAFTMESYREHPIDVGFANLIAFAIGAGIAIVPLIVLSARSDWLALELLAAIIILSFVRLFTRETERVWLMLMPVAIIIAANAIARLPRNATRRVLAIVLILLFAQTFFAQVFLYTIW